MASSLIGNLKGIERQVLHPRSLMNMSDNVQQWLHAPQLSKEMGTSKAKVAVGSRWSVCY